MNEIIKKRLLLVGIAFGMLITISPFIVFVMGMWKFLDGFGFIGVHHMGLDKNAPESILNGWCAFAISLNESNYICPIGVFVMVVCFAFYISIPKKTPPPLPNHSTN